MTYTTPFATDVTPDWEAFVQCVARKREPKRAHMIELFLDAEVKDAICERYDLSEGLDPGDPAYLLQREVILQRFLGYDYVLGQPLGIAMPVYDANCMEDMQVLNGADRLERPKLKQRDEDASLKMDVDDADAVLLFDERVMVALHPLTPQRFSKLMGAIQDGITLGKKSLVVQRHDKVGLLLYKLKEGNDAEA